MTDIVERLREGVFGGDETKTDVVIHSHMQAGADEIEWLRGERQRLADDLGKAHRDILPWIDQVGYLNGEWNLLVAALKQAADGLREVGAVHAADGIDAMLKEREPWSKAVFLPATKLT